tara:strand:- start:111 stop:434 length:324 start_codon:yes stop_codon:yes gene_type:complete
MLSVLPALLFNTAVASAEPYWVSKPVQCGTLEDIVESSKIYGEQPSVVFDGLAITQNGDKTTSKFIIATNEETKTWTLIEFPAGQNVGCILGKGTGLVRLLGQGEPI